MSEKLLIVVSGCDPHNAAEISEPIYHATVAASMDYQVEVIFTGRGGEVAFEGVATDVPSLKDDSLTLYDMIKDAHENGVIFKVGKLLTLSFKDREMIPEIEEVISGGYLISAVMDPDTVSMTY